MTRDSQMQVGHGRLSIAPARPVPLARRAKRAGVSKISIRVVSGPQRDRMLELGHGGITVGSSGDNELSLSDPFVAAHHLRLEPHDGGVRVTDLNSLSGTYYRGAKISQCTLLRSAVVVAGGTALHVCLESGQRAADVSAGVEFGHAQAYSLAMRRVFHKLGQAAATTATVLFEGPSGVGKDILASSLHAESPRRDRPYIVVDCAAIPETLIESELFGHCRGAFTGASAARPGAFELAQGGTLFLDEIGELPLSMQPKLLRALESRTFRRVGEAKTVHMDVRIVAATNRDLRKAVRDGQFRDDLYYRLAVLHIMLPALAQRPEDVACLAESFLRKAVADPCATLTPEFLGLLTGHEWPGNARELRNVVERFATYREADRHLLFDRPQRRRTASETMVDLEGYEGLGYHEAKRRLMESFHGVYVVRAIVRAEGSLTRAARALHMPRPSVSRIVKGLDPRRPSTHAPPR